MSELLAAEQFIFDALTIVEGETPSEDLSDLAEIVVDRVYSHIAPQDANYPCIVFAAMSARDVRVIGDTRITCDSVYAVKVIGRGAGFAAIATAVDLVDSLLHGVRGVSVTDGLVLSCVRVQPFSQVEIEDGVSYYSRGGLYRLMIS